MNVRILRSESVLGLSAALLAMAPARGDDRADARLVEEDGDRGQVPLRGRGDRRRQQGRQARRPDRRFVVRGPVVDQARHPQAGRLRRRAAQLQRVHDLLDRRRQRRRLGRSDRHRLSRRARHTGTRTPRESRATGPGTRSGTAPATRRRSTPTSSATAIACWSWAGSPGARTMKARWPGSRPAAIPTQPWEMHPVSEPSRPGHVIPGTFRFSHGLGVGDLNGDGRQRRDLHRRLVGTAGVGPQDQHALDVPPRPAGRRRRRHDRLRREPRRQGRRHRQLGPPVRHLVVRAGRRQGRLARLHPARPLPRSRLRDPRPDRRGHQSATASRPGHGQAILVARQERAGLGQARPALLVRGQLAAPTARSPSRPARSTTRAASAPSSSSPTSTATACSMSSRPTRKASSCSSRPASEGVVCVHALSISR